MRTFLSRSFRTLLPLLCLAPMLPRGLEAAPMPPKKPNIIFILADDISPGSFSCYGENGAVPTPHIDRIANTGVQFETCFAPASCGPSRALLMTGTYANTTGAFSNKIWAFESRKVLFQRHTSWAKLLGEAGYATAIAGKWHCNRSNPWSREVGFDEYCLWENTDRIKTILGTDPVAAGLRNEDAGEDRYWNSPMIRNGEYYGTGPDVYGPDARCDFLLDFMDRKTKENTPFVAYWPTVLVHGPIARTPNSGENTSDEVRFREMVEYLDLLVGRMVEKTKDLGIYENTWFIFGSDNGAARVAKNRGIESGVRVPFVLSGPGVAARGRTLELTDYSDIAPTLLEIGGIRPEAQPRMDGKSLVPFLTEKTDSHRDWIYSYAGPAQVLRTKTHLLEARSEFLGKEQGRLYFTGNWRQKANYRQLDARAPGYPDARQNFTEILNSIPSHLCKNHSYWSTEAGKEWLAENSNLEKLASKLLENDNEPIAEPAGNGLIGSILSGLIFYERRGTGNGHPLFLFPYPRQYTH